MNGDTTMKDRTGGALVVLGVILVVVLIAGAILFSWYLAGYNKAVRLEEEAREAWANVDSALQRRMDLIPNLVETVKAYAAHEQELFEHIADARTKYFQAGDVDQKIEAANEVGALLSRLLMLQEQYPELKANQNFLALQDSLEGTENRINVARIRYNNAVKNLNTYAREFFGSFFCKRAGVKPMKPFEAAPEAAQPPRVDFGPDNSSSQ
jgi:LemA protein